MKCLLDTNIIIGFLKNDSEIVNFISKQDVINVSVITIGEMYYGANISSSSKKNRIIYEDFFSYCNILNITENTAKHYSDIKAKLKISGKPIPENDVWIAANALESNLTIVTRDKHLLELPLVNSFEI